MNIQNAKKINMVEFVNYIFTKNVSEKNYKRKETDNQINFDFKGKNLRVSFLKESQQWKYYDYTNNKNGDIVNFTKDFYNIKENEEVLERIESIKNEINNDKDFWEFK